MFVSYLWHKRGSFLNQRNSLWGVQGKSELLCRDISVFLQCYSRCYFYFWTVKFLVAIINVAATAKTWWSDDGFALAAPQGLRPRAQGRGMIFENWKVRMQGLHEDGMVRYIALRFTVTGLTEHVTSQQEEMDGIYHCYPVIPQETFLSVSKC